MAYRRRQGITRASTFKEETHHPPPDHDDHHHQDLPTAKTLTPSLTFTPSSSSSSSSFSPLSLSSSSSSSSSSSLAAQAIRASASQSHRESSLPTPDSFPHRSTTKVFDAYGDASTRNDSKGFWGVLAHKAKSILEDDNVSRQFDAPPSSRFRMSDTSTGGQSYSSSESFRKMDNPTLRKGLDKLTSSLNQIGDTFEKAFEEGRTIVENKTADIIQETRKLQIRRKGNVTEAQMQAPGANSTWQQPLMQPAQPQNQMNHETQLKASRDVAMATAAKAKLLLRELKTVKADLAFAKQRCSQLEEENKILRESREKGGNPADDDLIRLQLETLLAEKARLAHENSVYARENRFLREIVEYHQLTMQDVVYLDEGSEEVTEVYPITRMLSITPPTPASPPSPSEMDTSADSPPVMKEILPVPSPPQEGDKGLQSEVKHNSGVPLPKEDNTKNISLHDREDEKSTPHLKEEMQN